MVNAFEYGRALYMLAVEDNITEEILEQLDAVERIFVENPEYRSVLDTPAISTDEKPKLIDAAFSGAHIYVSNFLKILCARRAISQFGECVKAYRDSYDESRNIMRATAITARPMSERQIKALTEKLSGITGKNIIVTNEVDEKLIGGVTLRYGGKQLDGSVKARLDELRKRLSETIV